ncbi:hypothetical protein FY030_04660 [Ornithinimicrobium pratense]|uniref:Uncharacterized protein n=1 Tax=Ornithinimicrobium pratense TaxID=2593973 RepID=A0A5J6V325_9MICO|nr:hypothetical protein FY030_04660 [Ornithinimicrobium pratense]
MRLLRVRRCERRDLRLGLGCGLGLRLGCGLGLRLGCGLGLRLGLGASLGRLRMRGRRLAFCWLGHGTGGLRLGTDGLRLGVGRSRLGRTLRRVL